MSFIFPNSKVSRRQIFVKRELQIKFAVISLALVLLSNIGVWLLTYIGFKNIFATTAVSFFGKPILTEAHALIILFIATQAAQVFLIALFLSHLVAGPIYRIERAFMAMLDGNPVNHVILRKNDFLHETVDLLNRLIDDWNKLKERKPAA